MLEWLEEKRWQGVAPCTAACMHADMVAVPQAGLLPLQSLPPEAAWTRELTPLMVRSPLI